MSFTNLEAICNSLTARRALRDEHGDRVPLTFEEERALVDLPTFGGERPAGVSPAWSWDETRILVTAPDGSFRIAPRAEAQH